MPICVYLHGICMYVQVLSTHICICKRNFNFNFWSRWLLIALRKGTSPTSLYFRFHPLWLCADTEASYGVFMLFPLLPMIILSY